ncbi:MULTISPECIES: DoxX family protein [unclassified Mucilaginibacter]|uniref:DoxX family protein n=1 Tax=unclassified Mucilaginibacter TaxID=2617802 RepID=UPI002AC978F2|nr:MULTISPECIES: DoxX family protein [unclassified Mucilaginibacter]MEB0249370.1 DoxX family protein [Mucilaginibacter sp. 5B2]MEB0260882.1 DoxX family protein [Mucilaginibacter sp. 10I4]MEB0279883.1 DoxX family protein [Mucilaginibacter sp. 10B2]MEB0302856.1 DoxX family protein [Mucilaginibacter sp. 5C4]WPX24146.1 DoxX family protein [Mucilaginibacter sp. 5C4]
MKAKTIRIIYWSLTTLFVLAMLPDGAAGMLREKTGQEVMRHLGYPIYIMAITGAFKIAGAIAIAQNKYKAVKEWAFAGFFINFIGAFASRAFVGDGIGLLVPPLIMLAVMFTLYYFWKRYEAINNL